MAISAAIFGCSGEILSAEEAAFFRDMQPFGFILFARNCKTPAQVKALVAALRDTVAPRHAPVFIDQEGGRVARLKPPHWEAYPPAAIFAEAWRQNPAEAESACRANAQLIGQDLMALGINADCAPLADLNFPHTHDVIGDRAFGANVESVIALARAQTNGLADAGVLPVLKHIPGHGRATCDSHLDLPLVDTSLAELEATDFATFRALADLPLAMTAHITFPALDADKPVTLSKKAIDYIRQSIGFHGLLMSDDISMKALKGSIGELSAEAIAAGCDLVLHCNGDMTEMRQVAEHCGVLPAPRMDAFLTATAAMPTPVNHPKEHLLAMRDAVWLRQSA